MYTDVQFCGKSKISTFTLNKIKNNEEITAKIVNAVIENLNVNKDWLLTGKGKMFNETPKAGLVDANPYKDALVAELKSQVEYLKEMLKMALAGKNPNFRKAAEQAIMLFNASKEQQLIATA